MRLILNMRLNSALRKRIQKEPPVSNAAFYLFRMFYNSVSLFVAIPFPDWYTIKEAGHAKFALPECDAFESPTPQWEKGMN